MAASLEASSCGARAHEPLDGMFPLRRQEGAAAVHGSMQVSPAAPSADCLLGLLLLPRLPCRRAFEIAHSTAYLFAGSRPRTGRLLPALPPGAYALPYGIARCAACRPHLPVPSPRTPAVGCVLRLVVLQLRLTGSLLSGRSTLATLSIFGPGSHAPGPASTRLARWVCMAEAARGWARSCDVCPIDAC